MLKVNNEDNRMTSVTFYFTPFFSVYIIDFEQLNVCWEVCENKILPKFFQINARGNINFEQVLVGIGRAGEKIGQQRP